MQICTHLAGLALSTSGFVQQKFNLSVRVRDNIFYPGAGVDPGFC